MSIILPDGTEVREIVEQVDWLTENHTSGEASGDNWSTITIDGVTKNIPTGGGGGTSDFDQLSNRPKYNGSAMTHETNIPEVKTATWDGKSVVSGQSSDGNWTSITIDGTTKSIPQGGGSTYTAGDGIDITNNSIAVKHGSYLGFDSSNQLTLNNYAKTRIEAVDSKSEVSAATIQQQGAATAKSITIDGTPYNLPEGGTGTSDFNDLSNRPKYNGSEMTGDTNIPLPISAISAASGITVNSTGVHGRTIGIDYAANDGLKIDGNDQLTVDYDYVQARVQIEVLEAGDT